MHRFNFSIACQACGRAKERRRVDDTTVVYQCLNNSCERRHILEHATEPQEVPPPAAPEEPQLPELE